jgi:prevent-host-death family protein
MRISVADAKIRLTDLLRRAEAGEEVVLTRRRQDVARLVPIGVAVVPNRAARRKLLDEVGTAGSAKAVPGPDAARSQDFLYNEAGLLA